MRINKFVAQATGLSRRAADTAIADGRILVNHKKPEPGQQVMARDLITLDGKPVTPDAHIKTIILNKPTGYICSRDGQGGRTIYELIPIELHHLKPVGRLDKDSSGLLLMTNDGQLAHQLTHPKFEKIKKYKIALHRDLTEDDLKTITQIGVMLEDGVSKFNLEPVNKQKKEWKVQMKEGRNRQIRRTFGTLEYRVVKLHRTHFGAYELGAVKLGQYQDVPTIIK